MCSLDEGNKRSKGLGGKGRVRTLEEVASHHDDGPHHLVVGGEHTNNPRWVQPDGRLLPSLAGPPGLQEDLQGGTGEG